MTIDVSTLVLKVTSDGIKEGTDALNNLTEAADKAEKKVGGIAKAMNELNDSNKSAIGAAEKTVQKLQEQSTLLGESASKTSAYKNAKLEANKADEAGASAMASQRAALDGIGKSLANNLKASTDTTNSQKNATNEIDRYIKKLQEELAMVGATAAKRAEYNATLKNATDAQKAQIVQLGQQIDSQKKLTAEIAATEREQSKHSRSFIQNSAAIRESLVLTHELATGSFKRFGGSLIVMANYSGVIPGILRAVATASAGTIAAVGATVLVIGALAAAIVALPFVLIAGHTEQKKFNDAILQTGNFAGVSTDSLYRMSQQVAATGVTMSAAKDAILQVASSGKFAADQILTVAEAVAKSERAFGSGQQTMQDFEKIATLSTISTVRSTRRVTEATVELVDKYHHLTLAQFEEIKALEKSGQQQEAARLSTDLLGKAIKERSEESVKHLGYLAQMWHWVAEGVSAAYSAVMNWGKEATTESVIQKEIDRLHLVLDAAKSTGDNSEKQRAIIEKTSGKIEALEEKLAFERLKIQKKGQEQQEAQDAIHGSNRLDTMTAQGSRKSAAQTALEEYDLLLTKKYGEKRIGITRAELDARQVYYERSLGKEKRGNDDTQAMRELELTRIKGQREKIISEMQLRLDQSKTIANKEHGDQKSELTYRQAVREATLQALEDNHNKQLSSIAKFEENKKKLTPVERAKNEQRREQVNNAYEKEKQDIINSGLKDAEDLVVKNIQAQDKLAKSITQTSEADDKRLNKHIKSLKVELAGTDELKSSQLAQHRENEEEDLKAMETKREKLLLSLLEMDVEGELGRAAYKNAMDAVEAADKQIAKGNEILALRDRQIAKQKILEEHDRETKRIDEAVAAAKRFETAMTEAFGNVGKAIGGMAAAFADFSKRRDEAQVNFLKASEEDKKSGRAKADMDRANANAEIGYYAATVDAAKKGFNEKSRGYQLLDGISKSMHLAELARNAAATISNIAAGASKMFAQSGFGGFAGVAAMAAVMAGFGYAVMSSSGGSGLESSEEVQKKQGTGSVFGDAAARSESIAKSLDIVSKNSDIMLPINREMLKSLRSIESAMGGLANLIVRESSLMTGSNFNVKEGVVDKSTLTSTLIGAQLGSMVGPLGLIVGGAIGGLVGAVSSLWGKTTQKLVDSGIQLNGKISDLQKGIGYQQYAAIEQTKSSWFGLSKSTSGRIETQGLDPRIAQQFGLIFTNMQTTLESAAKALGKDAGLVGNAIKNLVLDEKISLKGLSGKDLQDALNGIFSKAFDKMAETAFPGFEDFIQMGEGYAQTVIRVASAVEKSKVALDSLKIWAIDFSEISDKTGDVALQIVRQSILLWEAGSGVGDIVEQLSGSVDDLLSIYKELIDIRRTMQNLDLGWGLSQETIKAAGGLKELADGLKVYSDKYFSTSEKIAIETKTVTEAFADIGKTLPTSRAELRSWIEVAAWLGDQEQLGKLLALTDVFDKLFSSIDPVTKALSAADEAFKKLSEAIAAEKAKLDEQIKDVTGKINALGPILKSLEKAIEDTSQYDQRTSRESALALLRLAAAAEDISSFEGIDKALAELSKPSENLYSSFLEYQRDQARANSVLRDLEDAGNKQLTDAQKQLDSLNAQKALLDLQLKTAQDQLNVIKGIDISVKSVKDALSDFSKAISSVLSANAAQGTPIIGMPSMPSFDVGTNNLPYDTPAMVHKGERIIPAADNAELMRRLRTDESNSSSISDAALIAKLSEMIDVIMKGDVANVQKTNDMYRIIRDWDGNGLPPTRQQY